MFRGRRGMEHLRLANTVYIFEERGHDKSLVMKCMCSKTMTKLEIFKALKSSSLSHRSN